MSSDDKNAGQESSAQSDKAKIDNRARLKEITAVLRRHQITRGVTPEKLRAILEELGPTYVKLGQIMSLHSDVLPQRYCDELMKLTSEVTPMPFEVVEEVINRSYREDWRKIFSTIERETLGSASIAQVYTNDANAVSLGYAVTTSHFNEANETILANIYYPSVL